MSYNVLLDYDGFICKAFYASKVDGEYNLEKAQEILDRLVDSAIERAHKFFKTDDKMLIGKYITRHSGKKDIYPNYKGQREKNPLLGEFRDMCIAEFDVFGKEGYEADDFIINETLRKPTKTLVFSDDKDIKYYVPNFCKINLTEEPACQDLEEMQKCAAAQLLAGDREDNIKGLSGIGMHKALKLLGDDLSIENIVRIYQEHDYTFDDTLENIFLLLPLDIEMTPQQNYLQTRADLYTIWRSLEGEYNEI